MSTDTNQLNTNETSLPGSMRMGDGLSQVDSDEALRALLRRAQCDDQDAAEAAFTTLWTQLRPLLFTWLLKGGRWFTSPGTAYFEPEDILQQCGMRLWRLVSERRIDFENMQGFLAYLRTILRSSMLDYYRSASHERARTVSLDRIEQIEAGTSSLPEPAALTVESFEEDVMLRTTLNDVFTALSSLDVRQQQCLKLSAIGFKYGEIARQTGLRESMVNNYIHQARKALRRHIEPGRLPATDEGIQSVGEGARSQAKRPASIIKNRVAQPARADKQDAQARHRLSTS